MCLPNTSWSLNQALNHLEIHFTFFKAFLYNSCKIKIDSLININFFTINKNHASAVHMADRARGWRKFVVRFVPEQSEGPYLSKLPTTEVA